MSTGRYVVRPASCLHESALRGLQYLCLPHDEVVGPAGGFWWLVWHRGNPVGFAGLTISTSWPEAGFLIRAGVLPDHRGQGLQRRLIDVRVRKARALGLTHVVSTTFDNPHSSNNLIKAGFRAYTPTEPWGAEGTNYWIKKL